MPHSHTPTHTRRLQLTEEETEYKILCVKHVLEAHVVFQFLCTNTVREQVGVGVWAGGGLPFAAAGTGVWATSFAAR